MKRLFISLFMATMAFMLSMTINAQSATNAGKTPDMEKIRTFAKDSRKYNKLMKRYEENDRSLTLEDYRQLYFGYIFQPEYKPYEKTDYTKSVSTLYYKEELNRLDCDSIIKYAELSLKEDPFDLQQMNYLIYAYQTKKKHNLAKHWQSRLNNIVNAILSTGTGDKQESAWHIISIPHEYALINFINSNYIVDRQEFIEPYYDYIILKKMNDNTPTGFYFNIQYMLDNYNNRFK